MQDTTLANIPKHVAIIMDGNGRWAKSRFLPRTAGHKSGLKAVRAVVQNAAELGIEYLTLFGFSSENWNRPEGEVNELMGLLRFYLKREVGELHKQNVRLRVIGDRARLAADIQEHLASVEKLTCKNSGLTLVIALSYGSRDEITNAVKTLTQQVLKGEILTEGITEEVISSCLFTGGIPDPDLLIRTSGEKRISNFLLWQIAYSEIVFVDTLWPDFNKQDLIDALEEYSLRERRYGSISN